MVNLMEQSIVLMVLQHLKVVLVNIDVDIEALATPLQDIFFLVILLVNILLVNRFLGQI